jgi:hypothetical protein
MSGRKQTAAVCANCRHFSNDPAYLEAQLPGLKSLSSAYGSVRGDDGLCERHGRFAAVHSSCPQFEVRRI